jgi:hypothetical protein
MMHTDFSAHQYYDNQILRENLFREVEDMYLEYDSNETVPDDLLDDLEEGIMTDVNDIY